MKGYHVDPEQKKWFEISIVQTHSGQKKAYGDSFYEYNITSALPADQIEKFCCEALNVAIPEAQWRAEDTSMNNHFRNYYTFTKKEEGKYFYQVIYPYAD